MAPNWSPEERAILLEVRDRLAAGGTPPSSYTYDRIGRYLGRLTHDSGKSPVAQVQYERSQKRRLDANQEWTEPRLPWRWTIEHFLKDGTTFADWCALHPNAGDGKPPLGSQAVNDAAEERERRIGMLGTASSTLLTRNQGSDDKPPPVPPTPQRHLRQAQNNSTASRQDSATSLATTPTNPSKRTRARSGDNLIEMDIKKVSTPKRRYGAKTTISNSGCDNTECMLGAASEPAAAEKTLDGITDSSAFRISLDILKPHSDTANDVMQSIHEKFSPGSPTHPRIEPGNDHVLPPVSGWDLYARNRETYGKRLRPRFMVLVAMEQLRQPSVLYASRIPRALAAANRIMQGADASKEVDLALKQELQGGISDAILQSKSSDPKQGKRETPAASHQPMRGPAYNSRKRTRVEFEDVGPAKRKSTLT